MVNRRLLTIILGTLLSASFASVNATDMRNRDDSNVKRGAFQDHINVAKTRPYNYYSEPGFRYRDRDFNSSRRFRTHHRFLRHNRGHDGFLLGFGLGRYYNSSFSYDRYGYNGPGFRARHLHRHDWRCGYRY